ncbi:hypothetical protein ACX0G9_17935 [Flavitalea flava]
MSNEKTLILVTHEDISGRFESASFSKEVFHKKGDIFKDIYFNLDAANFQ